MPGDEWSTATAVLRLGSKLVDGIQQGVAAAGFPDVRPVHGFAFVRLSEAPATTAQLAQHLGITKQATSEIAQYLVDRGYLTRVPDPTDRRARLLVLTDRGRSCTRAAQAAASRTVHSWEQDLTDGQKAALRDGLVAAAGSGRLRPAW
ncbi:MarR family winged helix-turn-helix transcriptional regulator [Allobranchiibius sp. CTAmp26]|uniref:MarR family winged helix-turn-helix transcriptional regulator n=1 Tax=Allobranchiibius sp. CTAmp26 TaxID=2815214 RepID=UPI001AA197A3|nr:MarR family transcriptional regulator [Allobranchiibius sp. CTAmp26]MBO1756874.1 MarR family transcriptional regulator [Allobranchiibius sp. CTAmp26]